jgi:integrase
MAREVVEDTDTKYLFKRGNVWWMQVMRDGIRVAKSTRTSILKDAQDFRDRELNPLELKDEKDRAINLLGKIAGVDAKLAQIAYSKPATEINDGWKCFLEQPNRPDTGERTLMDYEGQYMAFSKWIAEAYPDIKELRRVTKEHADKYASMLGREVSPNTYNKHLNLLTLVWKVLGTVARIDFNPWRDITRKRVVVHSRRELTVEELKRVIDASEGQMRVLLAIGIYTGLRLADAACIKWSNIDMMKRVISLIPAKTARRTQKRITIPIHHTLYSLLNLQSVSKRIGYVLPEMKSRFDLYNGALSKDIGTLFESVGIPVNANADEKKSKTHPQKKKTKAPVEKKRKRTPPDCGFHSLRHTFVSLCASGGVSQSVVQSLVGHGNPAMTQHYTHIALSAAQDAIHSLPSITGEIDLREDSKLPSMLKDLSELTDKGLATLLEKTQQEILKRTKITLS